MRINETGVLIFVVIFCVCVVTIDMMKAHECEIYGGKMVKSKESIFKKDCVGAVNFELLGVLEAEKE